MNNSKACYSAFDTAVYLLNFKNRTYKELADKLKSKGYSDTEIDNALDKLSSYNYVNDESYTLSYIKSNMNKKGKRLIRRELTEKGIDKAVIDEKFDELSDEYGEEDNIETIFLKRFSEFDLNDVKSNNKIYSYFLRRGFSFDKISKIVTKYKKINEFDNCL